MKVLIFLALLLVSVVIAAPNPPDSDENAFKKAGKSIFIPIETGEQTEFLKGLKLHLHCRLCSAKTEMVEHEKAQDPNNPDLGICCEW